MVDGYFIRSLLLAFFFKMYPEIIKDGRLFIAEPPLYRVEDKRNPFVINRKDYIERYVRAASKDYRLGYQESDDETAITYLTKDQWAEFLGQTSSYVEDIDTLVDHYKVNDRLLEIILEEFALMNCNFETTPIQTMIDKIDIQHLMDRIGIEFSELYYDDKRGVIRGPIDAKSQMVGIDEALVRRSQPLIEIMKNWMPPEDGSFVLKDNKTGSEHRLSLLGILKILKKYQPNILHRFKGLGENDDEDIKTTIMDPNTRTLIRVNIGDIENDMKVFQVLRGNSPIDALARRQMMKDFRIPRDEIDT